MLGMVHLVAVHMKHLPFVREIRPGYCKTALLGLLVKNGLQCLKHPYIIPTLICLCALNVSSTQEDLRFNQKRYTILTMKPAVLGLNLVATCTCM